MGQNKYDLGALKARLEQCARDGEVIAYRDLAADFGDIRRRELVDRLDKINAETCHRRGILLSVVVVGHNGMPDSGFFDKEWPLPRWKDRKWEDVDSRTIFREELAAVYHEYDAPVRVYVSIDLENASNDGWRNALCWFRERGYRLFGVACTKNENKKARRWLNQEEFYDIEFRLVPSIGRKGQEADAAVLVEFGRVTHRVTTRDFVCFIAVADRIYKPAVEIALSEKMKVLRFCSGETLKWRPKNEGVYHPFDIKSPESWDAVLGGLDGN